MSLIKFIFLLFFIAGIQIHAQETPTPATPRGDAVHGQPSQSGVPGDETQAPGTEALPHTESPDLVIKRNVFSYDSTEGRDPFKIYREMPVMIPGQNGSYDAKRPETNLPVEKNIRTITVPNDVILQGILFKKSDPIALVSVKGLKGINQLKVNSPIGRNEGKVIEIQKDHVVVEQVKDFDGQKFTEKIVLKVRDKKK